MSNGVQVVNKATGELIELDYDSFEDFATQYDEVRSRRSSAPNRIPCGIPAESGPNRASPRSAKPPASTRESEGFGE